jgi:FtsP/CotA-like multicopper oxidase with cupredoxin domain
VTAGDTVVAELVNLLPGPAGTSVHWHGVAVPNAMDGAPPITQREVAPGDTFTYRFTAANPGTYFLHPHVGMQLDTGLYAPLVVEDPDEPLAYDDEWVVVLDDWRDGTDGGPGRTPGESGADGETPDGSGSLSGSGRPRYSELLGGRASMTTYPYHLVNGRVPDDPAVYCGRPGTRLRLRIINAGADTAYRVALGGHRLTVTHTDGYPVEPQEADAVLVGMAERYDALVTLDDGVFPLTALAEGSDRTALALVRTGAGTAPDAGARPAELYGDVMTADRLTSTEEVRLEEAPDDVVHRVRLTGSMKADDWSVNGRRFDEADPFADPMWIAPGQRVRLDVVNHTAMWHPVHLHGHTFQLGTTGARKDTVAVLPHRALSVHFDADNPGDWLLHCHNLFHQMSGMMALLSYTS